MIYKLGPILNRITSENVEKHNTKSSKLVSAVFCGDVSNQEDEDDYINIQKEYDSEL